MSFVFDNLLLCRLVESHVTSFLCASTAFYVPPKQEQAFLQGGTFIFDGPDTVYAHYDESTAAHANVDEVIKLAMSRVTVPT